MLVVDDESNMRFLLRMVFESEGLEVVEASHGGRALELLAEMLPDVILTDVMMPVMDGRELVARLRASEATAGIPIVMMSGGSGGEPAGADALVSKPFDIESIVEVVLNLIRRDEPS